MRKEILKNFQTKSTYDRLVKLKNELQTLASTKLPLAEKVEDVEILLADYRAKLKTFRDDADDLSELKKYGKSSLPIEQQHHFDNLFNLCSEIGLFIVWVGELESWLVDYGIERTSNKSKWIAEALTKIYDIEYDGTKEIWKFVDKLRGFLIS